MFALWKRKKKAKSTLSNFVVNKLEKSAAPHEKEKNIQYT